MSAQSNIELAKKLGLDVTWDEIKPKPAAGWATVDFTGAEEVPQSTLKKYKTTKGLGKTISERFDYALMIRTNPADKKVYLLVNPNAEADRKAAAERKAAAAAKRKGK